MAAAVAVLLLGLTSYVGVVASRFWGDMDEYAGVRIGASKALSGNLDGWDIAERCREAHPDIPVIYTTGFSLGAHRPVPGSRLLHKPYQSAELVRVISAVVGQSRPSA
jgi:hypothetical protein